MRYIIAVLLSIIASPAVAFVDPCVYSADGQFAPSRPGPNDPITYHVSWWFAHVGGPSEQLVRIDTSQPATIAVDVALVPLGERLPGYEPFLELPPLGPLAPGKYTVNFTVLVRFAPGHPLTPACGNYPHARELVIGDAPGPVSLAEVVEFYHAGLDHYFLTAVPAETALLDTGGLSGWTRTGQSFLAYVVGGSDRRGRPIHRYYGLPSAGLDTHFYKDGREPFEGSFEPPGVLPRWVYEGVAFELGIPRGDASCSNQTIPVYRLWNGRADTNHRYTTSIAIKEEMMARGYIAEGHGPDAVLWCAPVLQ